MNSIEHKKNVENCRDIILERIGDLKPKMAIILGSGLAGMIDKIENPIHIKYEELAGFPELKVEGHVGELIAGTLNGTDIIAFKGRQHFYETDDAYPLKTLIRTAQAVGVETLFVTNAAGSLRSHIKVSEIMLITDHINNMGFNPLVGENDDDFGPRFPALSNAWDKALGDKLRKTATELNIELHEGVYMAFRGPSFETPAEIRMAQTMGADAVGMSSVPDCIIARHCGLKVIGCSCITNMGEGLSDEKLSHSNTLENAARGAENFQKLIFNFTGKI